MTCSRCDNTGQVGVVTLVGNGLMMALFEGRIGQPMIVTQVKARALIRRFNDGSGLAVFVPPMAKHVQSMPCPDCRGVKWRVEPVYTRADGTAMETADG